MLFSRFDACRSGRGGGDTVVGGDGVAIGSRVPSCGWAHQKNGMKSRDKQTNGVFELADALDFALNHFSVKLQV